MPTHPPQTPGAGHAVGSSDHESGDVTTSPSAPTTKTVGKPLRSAAGAPGRPRRIPLYAVVLHDDDTHSVDYAVESLQKVFGYNWPTAQALVNKVERHGRAHVWTGPLETAEFKRDRLQHCGQDPWAKNGPTDQPLDCDIEPIA